MILVVAMTVIYMNFLLQVQGLSLTGHRYSPISYKGCVRSLALKRGPFPKSNSPLFSSFCKEAHFEEQSRWKTPKIFPKSPWYSLKPSSNRRYSKTRRKSVRSGLLSLPLIFVSALTALPTRALAETISFRSAKSFLQRKGLLTARGSLRILMITFTITFIVRMIRLRARQALDATSEWSRYAKHPTTRARALGSLLVFQLLPLWSFTRVLEFFGRDSWAQKTRTRTGNVFAEGLLRLG